MRRYFATLLSRIAGWLVQPDPHELPHPAVPLPGGFGLPATPEMQEGRLEGIDLQSAEGSVWLGVSSPDLPTRFVLELTPASARGLGWRLLHACKEAEAQGPSPQESWTISASRN